ncbi:MAG: riboflavin synthase, partial [Alphaproteobacteria bacterium]|nr:riboflavin synthase [Alphaproteobacteria bacterium]
GASIACNGVCLTVIRKTVDSFTVQMSAETVGLTTAQFWQVGARINLEPALRAGDELGGHYVSGHVDGLATVVSRKADGDSQRFVFEVPDRFASFIASKGSVALEGVSLTVNEVDGLRFGVCLIPHTLTHTTLNALQVGDKVNLEVDMVARYVRRMMTVEKAFQGQ